MKLRTLFVLFVLLVAAPVHAQDDDACPALVDAALAAVGHACGGLGRDEACYGNTHVDATFWEPRDDLVFAAPADIVPLVDLKRVVTAPLDLDAELWGVAVLKLQANLPEAALAPGQAVTFLLMGDASLENEVTPVAPVTATTAARSNLRSGPTTAANVVDTVDAGTELALVGVNTAGDWYETADAAWIWGELVAADDPDALADLPVTDAAPRYGPMQAFYLSAGVGTPTCAEAPNALVVQSPQDVEVMFTVNGMEVTLGSTAVFTMTELEVTSALMMTLVEGRLRATFAGKAFELTAPGQAVGVTLNEAGRVDADSEIVEPKLDVLSPRVDNACDAAAQVGVLAPAACEAEVIAYEPSPAVAIWLDGSNPCDPAKVTYGTSVTLSFGNGYVTEAEAIAWRDAAISVIAVNGQNIPVAYTPIVLYVNDLYSFWTEAQWIPPAPGAYDITGTNDHKTVSCTVTVVGESSFDVGDCESGVREGADGIRPGQTVTIFQGCRWPDNTRADAEARVGTGYIAIDDAPLSVFYPEVRFLEAGPSAPAGWEVRVGAAWVATPGTHTVSATMPPCPPYACIITVE